MGGTFSCGRRAPRGSSRAFERSRGAARARVVERGVRGAERAPNPRPDVSDDGGRSARGLSRDELVVNWITNTPVATNVPRSVPRPRAPARGVERRARRVSTPPPAIHPPSSRVAWRRRNPPPRTSSREPQPGGDAQAPSESETALRRTSRTSPRAPSPPRSTPPTVPSPPGTPRHSWLAVLGARAPLQRPSGSLDHFPLPDHLHPQHLDHLPPARGYPAPPRTRSDPPDAAWTRPTSRAASPRHFVAVTPFPSPPSTPSPSAHSAKRKPSLPPPPPPRGLANAPRPPPRASSIDSAPPSPRGTDRAMMTRCTSRRDARDAPATAPVPCVDRRVPPRRYPDPARV